MIGVRHDLRTQPVVLPTTQFAREPKTVAEALDRWPLDDTAPNHERGLDSYDVVERLKLIPPAATSKPSPRTTPWQ